MLRRPLQTDQARRVHRALSHAEDPPEALLDQRGGVPDLNADAGLLPGCAGPLCKDLRSQPVRRLVDQIPGQCRGLGQRQGSRQRLLPLGGVGQGETMEMLVSGEVRVEVFSCPGRSSFFVAFQE